MEYEKCFVLDDGHIDDRAKKRRRVEPTGLHASWPIRQKAYQTAWEKQKACIDERLDRMNATTIEEVTAFLDEPKTEGLTRMPTGIILSGANATAYHAIIKQLSSSTRRNDRRAFASLSPGSGSNLKAVLKALIKAVTRRNDGEDDDEEIATSTTRNGPRLLNYDLQLLHDFVVEKKLSQVVVSFESTEAFDNKLLSDVLEMLGCWLNRIPFMCLLSVSTSVDFLQQRLSRSTVRLLEGRLFDIAPSSDEVEQVFDAIISADASFYIGPNLASMMLERQRDYIQSIRSLVDATQYVYLSCYYANALMIFAGEVDQSSIPADHFDALRTLPCVQNAARSLKDKGKIDQARLLAEDDDALYEFCSGTLRVSLAKVKDMISAINLVSCLQFNLPGVGQVSKSGLYVQAMSGRLKESPLTRNLMLSIRKSPSDVANTLLNSVSDMQPGLSSGLSQAINKIRQSLENLTNNSTDQTKPLRSEDDIQRSTLRTTVVAQKVELSKQKATLSKQDTAYTSLLRTFTDLLEDYFEETLVNPKDLPLNEIFLYDLRSPYREVFMPRPKHAIERALSSPHDYLDCDCCAPAADEKAESSAEDKDAEEAVLSSSQPATAILYQLYLESGGLINASDMWEAFKAVLDDNSGEEEEELMALYQSGLAEMKYLGFVKSTRKKVDHIAKVAWKGL